MMNYNAKKMNKAVKTTMHDIIARRQAANYERFMQEKADVFQVTEVMDQAMFWVLG